MSRPSDSEEDTGHETRGMHVSMPGHTKKLRQFEHVFCPTTHPAAKSRERSGREETYFVDARCRPRCHTQGSDLVSPALWYFTVDPLHWLSGRQPRPRRSGTRSCRESRLHQRCEFPHAHGFDALGQRKALGAGIGDERPRWLQILAGQVEALVELG
jgi:hypothetical protein